jgi:hypothetical protein
MNPGVSAFPATRATLALASVEAVDHIAAPHASWPPGTIQNPIL